MHADGRNVETKPSASTCRQAILSAGMLKSTATAKNRRDSCNRFLSVAAALLAASALALAAADILSLTDLIQTGQHTGFRISAGCEVVYDLILVVAFGLSGVAFRSRAERRSRRLEVGATLA